MDTKTLLKPVQPVGGSAFDWHDWLPVSFIVLTPYKARSARSTRLRWSSRLTLTPTWWCRTRLWSHLSYRGFQSASNSLILIISFKLNENCRYVHIYNWVYNWKNSTNEFLDNVTVYKFLRFIVLTTFRTCLVSSSRQTISGVGCRNAGMKQSPSLSYSFNLKLPFWLLTPQIVCPDEETSTGSKRRQYNKL